MGPAILACEARLQWSPSEVQGGIVCSSREAAPHPGGKAAGARVSRQGSEGNQRNLPVSWCIPGTAGTSGWYAAGYFHRPLCAKD